LVVSQLLAGVTFYHRPSSTRLGWNYYYYYYYYI